MRLLMLDDAGVMVPDRAIASIESAVAGHADAPPWLPRLIGGHATPDKSRRVLRLTNGGRVEVPGTMHIVDNVEVLALPDLLGQIGASTGIIGLAQLADDLLLVCDPNLLTQAGGGRPT